MKTTQWCHMADKDDPLVDIIASGVHDAKNVIFDALTRIDVAREHARGGQAADAVPLLDEAAVALDRAARGLATLLSAYRLERHENPVALLPVVVADLIEEVLLRAGSGGGEGLPVLEAFCACDQIWLLDRELVEEALVNAIQNARRYARRRIRLGAEVAGDWLNLRVEDDGPGFDGDASTRRGSGGGVGLIVGRRIARLHARHGKSGRLELVNGGELGGAVFSMWLPG
jgi:signal transduction histidine kinase